MSIFVRNGAYGLKFFALIAMLLLGSHCTTKGKFIVPEDTELYVHERPQPLQLNNEGVAVSRPFFWTAAGIAPAGGIKYSLKKGDKVVKEGRLRTVFRPVSIFWPPFATIYWPMGFNPDITYDLVNDTQK